MGKGHDYELLARQLTARLSDALGVATEVCEHNVRLQGRGTRNQIDALWIGVINGIRQRIIIECKNYGRALDQSRVHAFRSVVEDTAADGIPTTGVFVTPIGYQAGAKSLAETYDLVLLELREPNDADLEDRIVRIDINIEVRTVSFNNVQFDWVQAPSSCTGRGSWPTRRCSNRPGAVSSSLCSCCSPPSSVKPSRSSTWWRRRCAAPAPSSWTVCTRWSSTARSSAPFGPSLLHRPYRRFTPRRRSDPAVRESRTWSRTPWAGRWRGSPMTGSAGHRGRRPRSHQRTSSTRRVGGGVYGSLGALPAPADNTEER